MSTACCVSWYADTCVTPDSRASPAAAAQVIFKSVKDPADVAEALIRLWPWIEMALGECSWRQALEHGVLHRAGRACSTLRCHRSPPQ